MTVWAVFIGNGISGCHDFIVLPLWRADGRFVKGTIIKEFMLDKTYSRLALLALVPFLYSVALVRLLALLFNPIR